MFGQCPHHHDQCGAQDFTHEPESHSGGRDVWVREEQYYLWSLYDTCWWCCVPSSTDNIMNRLGSLWRLNVYLSFFMFVWGLNTRVGSILTLFFDVRETDQLSGEWMDGVFASMWWVLFFCFFVFVALFIDLLTDKVRFLGLNPTNAPTSSIPGWSVMVPWTRFGLKI